VDPVPDPLLVFPVVPGIEPGPPDLYPRTLATRPQRRFLNLREVRISRIQSILSSFMIEILFRYMCNSPKASKQSALQV
jgi:hypothetical protein